MVRSRLIVLGVALALPAVTGCASLNAYRPEAERLAGRFVTVQNFGTRPVDPAAVDALLLEVADLLRVTLDARMPKARVVVTSPTRIAALHDRAAGVAPHGSYAVALYLPGTSLVMVPAVDRELLGHELAHYVTDHYLKGVPRDQWEAIAHQVERGLVASRGRPSTVAAAAGPAPSPAGAGHSPIP